MRELNITVKTPWTFLLFVTYHKSIQYTQTAVWQRGVESSHYRRSSQTTGICTVHPICETRLQLAVVFWSFNIKKNHYLPLSPSQGRWKSYQHWWRAGEVYVDGQRGRRKDSCRKLQLRALPDLQTETHTSYTITLHMLHRDIHTSQRLFNDNLLSTQESAYLCEGCTILWSNYTLTMIKVRIF